mmetsp:Transcript_125987/g.368095  ORF Transcript_125987/g.368095 Transcript_125987/m.368095 type:complete len:265 (+) Transcript_125987:145-939(+)
MHKGLWKQSSSLETFQIPTLTMTSRRRSCPDLAVLVNSQNSWKATGDTERPLLGAAAGVSSLHARSRSTRTRSLISFDNVSGFWWTLNSVKQMSRHGSSFWLTSRSSFVICRCNSTWSSTHLSESWKRCKPTMSQWRSGCKISWTSLSNCSPPQETTTATWCSRSSRTLMSALSRAGSASRSSFRSWRMSARRTGLVPSACPTCKSPRPPCTRGSARCRVGFSSASSCRPRPEGERRRVTVRQAAGQPRRAAGARGQARARRWS